MIRADVFVDLAGHLVAMLAFVSLTVFASVGQRALRRTVRHAGLVYALIITIGSLFALINLFCFVDLLVFQHEHDLSQLHHRLARYPSVVALSIVVLALLGFKVVGERSPRPRRVLAIGAHPDDLEIACGATLAKMRDAGHQIQGVVLTCGERGGDASIRRHEALRGARFLELNSTRLFGFTDTRLEDHATEITAAIEELINEFKPDIILTHSAHDQHQDHQAVYRATLRAARNHGAILCYESPSVTREFVPSFFVDIGDYIEIKIESVREHRNQLGKPYMNPERVRGIALFRGGQAKTRYAEGFEVVRALSSALGDV
jgi:LmbE family N-acetylglucosaminyl deacetylase